MSSYLQDAKSDAQDTANNFIDEILESFMDNDGEASDDLNNDYSDSYHHENHVDKSYNLQEAAELLDELDQYEETDEGLWEGLKPRDAIGAQAAYTYGNAVYSLFTDIIKEINEDVEIVELFETYQNIDDTVQEEHEEAEANHEEEEDQKEAEHEAEQDRLEEADESYERTVYERQDFAEPFDVDDEIEKRQETIKASIKERMEAIIKAFTD